MVALAGHTIDAVIVGGIGAGALAKLQAMGARVYRATGRSVSEVLDAFEGGGLQEITPEAACGHHRHGVHDCVTHVAGHGHGHGHGGPHGSGRGRS
jgi:predicted Fe-Mo cluster-binding NifX family protein